MSERQYQRFSDRFIQISPLYTEAGWYLKLRDDEIKGPFHSRKEARSILSDLFGITPEMSGDYIDSTPESDTTCFSKDSRAAIRVIT